MVQNVGSLLQANQITQGGLTVFLTYDVCAGIYEITYGKEECDDYGFHTDNVYGGGSTPQVVTWLFAEYADIPAVPYTDVDVLSHEVGEWATTRTSATPLPAADLWRSGIRLNTTITPTGAITCRICFS
jgi:hypothetical protein